MAIDFTKSCKEVLLQRINQDNGTSFTANMVDFGVPTPIAGVVEAAGARNTTILIMPRAGSGLKGSVTLSYRRRNLNQFENSANNTFTKGGAIKIIDLLATIRTQLGIGLDEDDILDGVLPIFTGVLPNATMPFFLEASPACLAYVGKCMLYVRRQDIDLSSIITVPNLGVLPNEA